MKRLNIKPTIEIKMLLVSKLVFTTIDYTSLAYWDLNYDLTSKLQRDLNARIRCSI